MTNSVESCDKKPVCFGTNHDFLPFDGDHVCPEGHAYIHLVERLMKCYFEEYLLFSILIIVKILSFDSKYSK